MTSFRHASTVILLASKMLDIAQILRQEWVEMPLSDRERKELEELESGLAAEDPRLAQALSSGSGGFRFRPRAYAGAILCLAGVVLLILGVSTQLTAVGVGGFLSMGAGTYLFLDRYPVVSGRRRQLK